MERLAASGLIASLRAENHDTVLQLGPLAHSAVWLALEAFLGRPLPEEPPGGHPAEGLPA